MVRKKFVYTFEEGSKEDLNLLGGKGANLAEMVKLGFSVPPGFTITTETYKEYKKKGLLPNKIKKQVLDGIEYINRKTGKTFGSSRNPLLVSVRSGASISMPGMMETILNLGINYEIAESLIQKTRNPTFVNNVYKRFIKMFFKTTIHYRHLVEKVEEIVDRYMEDASFSPKERMNINNLVFNRIAREINYCDREEEYFFPTDPESQLFRAIEAVFKSWNSERAKIYRKECSIDDKLGTAVNVQEMVFGNRTRNSFTGVVFSRNKDTGKNEISGEYLLKAQGEDVVSGGVTPRNIKDLSKKMPKVYNDLVKKIKVLEEHYKDMQDVEITYDKKKLWFLQTRKGKRTSVASITIALDMLEEGIIDKDEFFKRITKNDLENIINKEIVKPSKINITLGKGIASSGIAVGRVALSNEKAIAYENLGDNVILVRESTDTEDIEGIRHSVGVLTSIGGSNSHAAIVAKGMNKVCILGCENIEELDCDYDEYVKFNVNGKGKYERVMEGDYITLDGNKGIVYKGKTKIISSKVNPLIKKLKNMLFEISDKSKMVVNIGSSSDIKLAREKALKIVLGNSYIFSSDKLQKVRDYILNEGKKGFSDKFVGNMTGKYASIFKRTAGDIYCNLFDGNYKKFFLDEKSINDIEKFTSSCNFFTKWFNKSNLENINKIKMFHKKGDYENMNLIYGILKSQIDAIVTGSKKANDAGKTNFTPVINVPQSLINKGGSIPGFVKNEINAVKKDFGYEGNIKITYGYEKDKIIFQNQDFIKQVFAYYWGKSLKKI